MNVLESSKFVRMKAVVVSRLSLHAGLKAENGFPSNQSILPIQDTEIKGRRSLAIVEVTIGEV